MARLLFRDIPRPQPYWNNRLGPLVIFPNRTAEQAFSVETILEYRDCNWIVILKWHQPVEIPLLQELCSLFIERSRSCLKCNACCSIGFPAPLESIGQLLHRLLSIHGEMTPVRNETYLMEDLTLLEDLLHRNDPVAFLGEIAKELRLRLGGQRLLNTSELSLFRLDIVQLVYSFLKIIGIQAHKLYTGKTNDSLLMHSLSSISIPTTWPDCSSGKPAFPWEAMLSRSASK